MPRKRKHRTHVEIAPGTSDNAPKSFVIKHGQVGRSLTQLVRDMRKVMEPNTASRLRERARNKLKDYVVLAPALHVTHLLAFTLTEVAPSLRIIKLPGGPTLSFRVERYSLVKDMLNSVKRAKSIGSEYLSPPLLVLASFPPPGPNSPPHLSLVMKTFQSLFPPLSPGTISLSSARRIVLISHNAEKGTIDFRHYLISVKPYGVSKRVQKVLGGAPSSSKKSSSSGFLDLGNERDVADFLLRKKGEYNPGGGYESAVSDVSSAAGDDGDAVSLAGDYVGRNNKRGQKKAIKLEEIGPRMELRLIKITEGLPGREGGVIYHDIVKKTKKEINVLKTAALERERLKKQRREEQEQNVEKKKALAAKKGKGNQLGEGENDKDEASGDDIVDEGDAGGDDDWDDEEEISEDEEDEEESAESEGESEPRPLRPTKKAKVRGHG